MSQWLTSITICAEVGDLALIPQPSPMTCSLESLITINLNIKPGEGGQAGATGRRQWQFPSHPPGSHRHGSDSYISCTTLYTHS